MFPVIPLTVLVVDDEETITEMLSHFLKHVDMTVTTVNDGAAAIRLVSEQPDFFDLIILDVVMPKLSGVQTLKEIHKIRPNINVILMSGYNQDEELKWIRKRDYVDFLEKPFDLWQLIRKITSLTARSNNYFARNIV